MNAYPLLEKATHDIEIPSPVRGRPAYRWVQGWQVRYSESRVSTAMRLREAQALLHTARQEA